MKGDHHYLYIFYGPYVALGWVDIGPKLLERGWTEDRALQFIFLGCNQTSAIKEGKVNSRDGETRQWSFRG